ncbi:MAG TPA: RidA family protein [Vicinamibacteria bacterium]|nr:RidA family protein [Vicinamibacteria bacterium]
MKHNALVLALGIAPSFAYGQPIERINPDGLNKPATYSHVVKVGNLLFISGQVAFDSAGNLVGENDMKAQVRQVLENLKTALASQKADFSHVAKINIFTTDVEAFLGAAEVRAEYFKGHPPASTLVQIVKLARPGLLVEIEAIAALP